jgi:transcriptional regulator with XRE-family HTH domain|tara:strand:+ start:477 stop:701 length:225 start_codon:yes stop_codon:yes gene_type:complete
MIECAQKCRELDVSCPVTECRSWINYEEDLNCTNIAIDKNGTMKLRQIAERLGLTPARVQQIEKGALAKLNKVM